MIRRFALAIVSNSAISFVEGGKFKMQLLDFLTTPIILGDAKRPRGPIRVGRRWLKRQIGDFGGVSFR